MIDVLPQIGLVVVLIALNAVFAGTELALVSLSEGQLQRLEGRSTTGAQLARLAREPVRFLATIQIGITLAGFLASAAAAVSLSEPLQGPLGFLGDAAGPVSIICVTLILTYLTLVFGELAPKRIAMQRAEKWALAAARPLAILTTFTRPAVWLLSRSTDIAVRLLDADPHEPARTVAMPAPVFPGAARVVTTMRNLQARRAQMAFVVNEYGRIDGIVTMEDLVEELVGEIYDETDPDRSTVEHEPDGTIVLPSRYPMHDLPQLGIDLPTGSYATIAGLVLRELHHIPAAGTTIVINDWTLEVRAVHDHAVTQVALRPQQSARRLPQSPLPHPAVNNCNVRWASSDAAVVQTAANSLPLVAPSSQIDRLPIERRPVR